MGAGQAANRARGWGEKQHERSDSAYIAGLVNKQEWKLLQALLESNPEAAQVPDKACQGMYPIHRAILKGTGTVASNNLIEALLETYPDGLLQEDENGMLPLHYASAYGYCTDKIYHRPHDDRIKDQSGYVLKMLLRKRPKAATLTDAEGRTPLHVMAASKACAAAIREILGVHGEAAGRRTKLGKLPLHYALENRSSVEAVRAILDAYPNAVGESSSRKNCLHCACEGFAAVETVSYLVENYPAGVREKSIDSMLPIHIACAHKQPLAVIKMLAEEHPESLLDRDRHSRVPLHHALEKNAPEDVVLYLIERAPETVKLSGYFPHLPLHIAVEKNSSLAVVQALLRCLPGSSADKDMFGVLPLRRVIKMKGEEEVVLAVLEDCPEAASDLDEYERLSLHYACGRNMSLEVISRLVDACPAGVSVPDKNGQLPLHLAVMRSAPLEILQLLISRFPKAVMVPDNFNYLPLHHVIELDGPLYVYECLLAADVACSTVRMEGKPPLHYAVEMRRSDKVLQALIDAHPAVVTEKESERGRIVLCWAMERLLPLETLLMLEKYHPVAMAAFEGDNSGRLPIHYAVEYDAPVELVRMLLKANPLVVTTKELPFYYYQAPQAWDHDTRSIIAHGKGTAAAAVEEDQVAEAAAEAEKESRRQLEVKRSTRREQLRISNAPEAFEAAPATEHTLDAGLEKGGVDGDAEAAGAPAAAPAVAPAGSSGISGKQVHTVDKSGPVSVRKKRDNHGEVSSVVIRDKNSLDVVWDETFQRSRPLDRRPGKMLIHYATEDMHCSAESVAEILALTMPITADTGAVNTYHGYGWTYLLSETKDAYVRSVDLLLDMYSGDLRFVQLLCDTPNEAGLMACDVATPLCLAAIMARLHYFSRYQVQPGCVAHESDNSVVRLAIDHHHHFAGPLKEKKAEEKVVVRVALKFMRHRVQYDREVQLRAAIRFDDKYVVPILCSHDGDADPAYKAETVKKGLAAYPYLVTMAAAERDLLGAIQHEHFAGVDFVRVKLYARQILEALQHVHERGLIHGDLKPLNVVRSNGRFKLIDLGAAVRFGDFAGTSKTSTAYLPPEMVFKKVATFKNTLEVAPNEEKADYFSTHEPQDYALSSKTGMAVIRPSGAAAAAATEVLAPGIKPPRAKAENPAVDPMPAAPNMDMWSFGVMLYLMATGENLFVSDISDCVDAKTLQQVVEPFPDAFKNDRLAKCTDHWTRNLIFQCLSRDPRRRPLPVEALAHPYFTGVKEDILDVYRMPGQPCKYDVCLCFSTKEHSTYRRELRHRQFVAKRNLDFETKEKADAAEVAALQAEHAKSKHSFLQVDFKPTSPDWVEPVEPIYEDCDQEEEAATVAAKLEEMGFKVCHCEGGKGLINSACAVIILTRSCCNNRAHPQQNFLSFTADSDYDPYFFEIRLALEMREQSYLESGVISLPVGDKEEGEVKLARLMAEKATRDRAAALEEERERVKSIALEKKRRREEAANASRLRNQAKVRGKAGGSGAKKQLQESKRGGVSASPSRESKQDGKSADDDGASIASIGSIGSIGSIVSQQSLEEQTKKRENKFWADEEAIRTQSTEPSYLPYYAAFENEVIGKYGGSHPGGKLSMAPVAAIEEAVVAFLKKYFLGRVPIINDGECSPAKLMSRITYAKQILVMGEETRAWRNAANEVHMFLRGHEVDADQSLEDDDDDEGDGDEGKAAAVSKFLRRQMEMKNNEIDLLSKEVDAAARKMQDAQDALHCLHMKFSIF